MRRMSVLSTIPFPPIHALGRKILNWADEKPVAVERNLSQDGGSTVERWLSGLRRTPGKREWLTPPGVRIPLSPPVNLTCDELAG